MPVLCLPPYLSSLLRFVVEEDAGYHQSSSHPAEQRDRVPKCHYGEPDEEAALNRVSDTEVLGGVSDTEVLDVRRCYCVSDTGIF